MVHHDKEIFRGKNAPQSRFTPSQTRSSLLASLSQPRSRLITLGSIVSQPAFIITSAFKGNFWGTLLVRVIRRLSDYRSISIL
jgi:hypothetical protein